MRSYMPWLLVTAMLVVLGNISGDMVQAKSSKPDHCIAVWLEKSGVRPAIIPSYITKTKALSIDEGNIRGHSSKVFLPLLLNDQVHDGKKVIECVERRKESCATSPACHHGGVCLLDTDKNGYHCKCKHFFTGPLCQKPMYSLGGITEILLGLKKQVTTIATQVTSLKSEMAAHEKSSVAHHAVLKKHTVPRSYESRLDGGGWKLVWKHSYLQVPRTDLRETKTFSATSKPCSDLSVGWCNVPDKQVRGASEQMIVAYHKGIVVYAYKSPLNPQLGKTEQGGRLMSGWKKVIDKCTSSNGVRPDIARHDAARNDLIWGLAFDKVSPGNINYNCDTVKNDYRECRWHDCNLPRSISSKRSETQMTMAIFVR